MMEIPYTELSPEALRGVLEEYATRGGFESDVSLESRIEQILVSLKQGKSKIVFDPDEGSTNLVSG